MLTKAPVTELQDDIVIDEDDVLVRFRRLNPRQLSPEERAVHAKHLTSLRMRRLRERLGYRKVSCFARYLGVSPARWSNVEKNFVVSREVADLLCKKVPGLTRDWIYDGNSRGLSVNVARLLGELPPGDENLKPVVNEAAIVAWWQQAPFGDRVALIHDFGPAETWDALSVRALSRAAPTQSLKAELDDEIPF